MSRARNRKTSGQFAATGGTKSTTDRFRRWVTRASRARTMRADWASKFQVEKSERFFLGDQDTDTVYNHFAATLKTSRPNLFFQMPKFYLRPRPRKVGPITERTAAIGEGVLESVARQDDHLEVEGNLAVLQAYFRVGVLKVCYDPHLEPNPNAGRPIYVTREGEPVVDEAGAAVVQTDPLSGQPLREPDEVLTDEVYRWRWVDAANLLLPDDGPNPLHWSWIGEDITVSLDEAKQDTRFPKDVRTRLQANVSRRDRRSGTVTPRRGDDDEELFQYTEIYDVREKRLLIWADSQDREDFLVDEPIPSWIEDHPYAVLVLGDPILGPDPSPWPKPVVRDWLAPQVEYNIRRQQINEGCKRAARKGVFEEGAFDDVDEAVKLMQSPNDMEWAKVIDVGKVKVLEVPALSADIWKDVPALMNDWRIITGQTGARLASPDAGTATEATFVERAANLRDADLQKGVIRWLAEAGRKMFQCIKETLTLEVWTELRELNDQEFVDYAQRVLGLDPAMLTYLPGLKDLYKDQYGARKWMPVTRTQLTFEADVTVVPGSTRPRNLEGERRAWLEFLKVLGAAPQLALSRELLRYTARMFEVEDARMLDELTALAEKMVAINANQAGRTQGSTNGASAGTPNGPADIGNVLAAVTGGMR